MISPTPSLHTSSGLVRLGALLVVFTITALAGCSAPTPTPTTTPAFASEEEAFAAAEETFTRYVEALNSIDASAPLTFEPLYALSSGSVEKADRENFSEMYAEGKTVSGDAQVRSFEGSTSGSPYTEVLANVCLDVSEVQVLNADGSSAVQADRPDIYALELTFVASSSGVLSVDAAESSTEFECNAL